MDAKLLPLKASGRTSHKTRRANISILELARVVALLATMAVLGFACGAALSALAQRAEAYTASAALLAASAPPPLRRLATGGNASHAAAAAAPLTPTPLGNAAPRIALLHKGHGVITARGVAAAVAAQRQVLAAGGWYGLLYSAHPNELPLPFSSGNTDNGTDNGGGGDDSGDGDDDDPPAAEAARASLLALRAALGDAAVTAVGRAEVAAALGEGLLSEQARVFGPEWAWATNDAVDATWFALHGDAALPAWVTHVWLAELDVGWTGSLPATLESTVARRRNGSADTVGGAAAAAAAADADAGAGGSATSAADISSAAREPDFVAFAVERSNAGWRWHAARNWLADGEVWRCYRHAARLSRALLRAHLAALRAGRVANDEVMAPSVCARESSWCALDAAEGSWRPGHPAVGADAKTGEALYRWELRIGARRWASIVRADEAAAAACARETRGAACPPGKLYHALKW